MYALEINLVDLLIILAVLVALGNGFQRGLLLSLLQYTGMVTGVVAGAAAAPGVERALGVTATIAPLASVLILVLGGTLGATLAPLPARLSPLHRLHPRHALSPAGGGGAAFSAAAVLATAWFLGLTFDRGPSPDVSRLVQRSAILRNLDAIAPRPPGFLLGTERILAQVPFPQTFAGLEPNLPVRVQPLPLAEDTPGIRAAAAETMLVEGRGCGGLVTGSAFSIGGDYAATNAHVVSGTSNTILRIPGGRTLRAQTVLFDPERDVAVLLAPGLALTALPSADGQRGVQGAVIGYPNGGPRQVVPAAVDGAITARGRDIYNEKLVDRRILIVEANVQPGNSGGPLVDRQGHVLGIVFAASSTSPGQGYALTNDEVAADLRTGSGRRDAIDTRQFACAV